MEIELKLFLIFFVPLQTKLRAFRLYLQFGTNLILQLVLQNTTIFHLQPVPHTS
jgi:hypothetical protein